MKLYQIIIILYISSLAQGVIICKDEMCSIKNCLVEQQVNSFGNINGFSIICKECQKGYVLTENYQQCLHFEYDLFDSTLANCSRMDNNKLCVEAIQGVELIKGNHKYYYQQQIHLEERCAIVSDDLVECYMPRFGYTLIMPNKKLLTSTDFCAIFNSTSGKCERYFDMFVKQKNSKNSVYIKDFFNFKYINHDESYEQNIICVEGYSPFLNQQNIPVGCRKQFQDDKKCSKYDDLTGNCAKCVEGYTINVLNEKCEVSQLRNCISHKDSINGKLCTQCFSLFYPVQGECKFTSSNCLIQSKLRQICFACNPNYSGIICEENVYIKDPFCEMRSGNKSQICFRCKEGYYLDLNSRVCKQVGIQCDKYNHFSASSATCANQLEKQQYYYSEQGQVYQDEFLSFFPNYFKNLHQTMSVDFYWNQADRDQEFFEFLKTFYGENLYVANIQLKIANSSYIQNCEEYKQNKDECKKCIEGFILKKGIKKYNYLDFCEEGQSKLQHCLVEDDSQCFLCQKGFTLFDGKCEHQQSNCLYKVTTLCIACEDDYFLDFSGQYCLSKNLFYKYFYSIKCKIDFDSFITQIDSELTDKSCQRTGRPCLIQENNVCIQCYPGYTLLDTECIYSHNLVDCHMSNNLGECIKCIQGYNLINKKCYRIDDQFKCNQNQCFKDCSYYKIGKGPQGFLQESECQLKCKDGKIVQDLQECNEIIKSQCSYPCESCSDQNQNICIKCAEEDKIFFEGNCLSECPTSYFLSDISRECIKCSQNCYRCQSYNKCEECIESQMTLSSNCKCSFSELFYNNECFKQCPFGSKQNGDQICERICNDGEFLVYDPIARNYYCQGVNNEMSAYCLQNLQNIPENAKFTIEKGDQQSDYIFLKVIFYETPIECYSFQIYELSTQELPISKILPINSNQTQFEVKIMKSTIIQNKNFEFENDSYYLNLKIFYLEFQQFLLKIQISFQLQILAVNQIQLVQGGQENQLCEDCEIFQSEKVESQTSIKCLGKNICADKLIVSNSEDIEIIHQVTQDQYLSHQLYPHSLTLKFFNEYNEIEQISIIHFNYDNSINGQIIYKIESVELQNGTLLITSRVLEQNKNLQLVQVDGQDLSQQKFRYAQNDIEIQIEFNQENRKESLLPLIILFFIILSLILILAINRMSKRKRQYYILNENKEKDLSQQKESEQQLGLSNKQENYKEQTLPLTQI